MSRYFRRKRFCKFTAEGIDQIDYKDLETLKGIGPALRRKLNDKGVYRLKQLADMDEGQLLELGKSVGVGKKQIRKQAWASQARAQLGIPEPAETEVSFVAEPA